MADLAVCRYPRGVSSPAALELSGKHPWVTDPEDPDRGRLAPLTVDWLDSRGNRALHFNPRPDEGAVLLNSFIEGVWGGHRRTRESRAWRGGVGAADPAGVPRPRARSRGPPGGVSDLLGIPVALVMRDARSVSPLLARVSALSGWSPATIVERLFGRDGAPVAVPVVPLGRSLAVRPGTTDLLVLLETFCWRTTPSRRPRCAPAGIAWRTAPGSSPRRAPNDTLSRWSASS